MSKIKKYELYVDIENVSGNQVFACEAESELDARMKYNSGQCEIIDQNIEVTVLGDIDVIEESVDITSRLHSDVVMSISKENQYLKQQVAELIECLESISADKEKYRPSCKAGGIPHYLLSVYKFDSIDRLLSKIKESE